MFWVIAIVLCYAAPLFVPVVVSVGHAISNRKSRNQFRTAALAPQPALRLA